MCELFGVFLGNERKVPSFDQVVLSIHRLDLWRIVLRQPAQSLKGEELHMWLYTPSSLKLPLSTLEPQGIAE